MSALLMNGQNIALDKEGFLLDLNDWSPAAAEALYASSRSLQERGLDPLALNLAVEPLDDQAICALIGRYDLVMTL